MNYFFSNTKSNFNCLLPQMNWGKGEGVGDKTYELKNHLGSVLVTISDRKILEDINGNNIIDAEDHYISDVISYADYYAFGMVMPGRNGNTSDYSFGFNGMRKDDEVKGNGNHLDYGARPYDTRLGRWLSVDPMAGKQPAWSPYKMAKDNPILFMDPDGNTEIISITIINKQTGEVIPIKIQISEEVRIRMNIQTAVPYFHDIEHSYVITIDKDGTHSMKTYLNQAKRKRGNWFTSNRADFRTKKFQKWGMYFTSANGEGTSIKGINILGSGNIDEILSLVKTLSSTPKALGTKSTQKSIKEFAEGVKHNVKAYKKGAKINKEVAGEDKNDEDKDTVITINQWETKGAFSINHLKDTTVKKSEVNTVKKDRDYVKGQ